MSFFFPEIATIGRLGDAVPLSLRNRSCPLSPPKRNKKRLHGTGTAGISHQHPNQVLRTLLGQPGQEEGSLCLHFACCRGWGGKSIPFSVAHRSHPLQEGCRQPSLLPRSSGAGAGGRKPISPRPNSLNTRWQQPVFFFFLLKEVFSSLSVRSASYSLGKRRPSDSQDSPRR